MPEPSGVDANTSMFRIIGNLANISGDTPDRACSG